MVIGVKNNMTNWFIEHSINPIYGWGPSKRWIVQAGPAVEDGCAYSLEDATLQFRGLVQQARKAGCVYVEIRCFEDYSKYRPALEAAGFVYEPHYDVHIKPLSRPSDTLSPSRGKGDIPMWIHESKRRQIRAAIAEGQCWREISLEDGIKDAYSLEFRDSVERDIEAWYKCLKQLYRTKVKRPIPNLGWFKELILEKGCKLLVVEVPGTPMSTNGTPISINKNSIDNNKIIGGVLLAVEDDKSKAYEWYICGQVMSTWAAIEWCRQNEVRCFDTMGAGKPGVPYGVRDFKLQMGGTLHEFGRYRCVLKPWLYRLGEWVMK